MLIAFTVVLVIFSYGWTVTDIDLSVPQEPQRQQNVGNALRELLSPNIFTQEYEVLVATTSFLVECTDGFTTPEAAPVEAGQPYITVEPACGDANEPVTVNGYGFAANGLGRINWIGTDGERRIRQAIGVNEDNFITGTDGGFSVQIEVPRIRNTIGETHTIEVQGRFPVGLPTFSATSGLVLEKMAETIFLALIATAVSILPSATLSFFAAHNLMQPIRTQLGTLLVTFTLLPVGWLFGTLILSQLGQLALNVGSGDIFTGATASLIFLVGTVASTRGLRDADIRLPGFQPRAILTTLLVGVGLVIVIGLIGGLGLLFGNTFRANLGDDITVVHYVATFIGSLGQMVELTIVPLSGIVGAVTVSSVGRAITKDAIKQSSTAISHIMGGFLGALSGAILLGITASIGMAAAWLGLLTAFAAASLAAPILPQLYYSLTGQPEGAHQINRALHTALSWVGGVAAFVVTFLALNIRQSLVEGVLPPQVVVASVGPITLYNYVWLAMLIGAALGGLCGALAGTKANFPLGATLYSITRTILNGLRSIEPLIMGLVFVIWVGIGPFAGVLALALHSIASLGKLYSEQIENIDAGPIEALQSTGANQLQTIMYAVVPQVIPPYIAFTMYRWDINVRMSTIIGFVGGGGIGFLLQQQINLLRYRDAGVAVLAIAIVVSVLDYASAAIRKRYI